MPIWKIYYHTSKDGSSEVMCNSISNMRRIIDILLPQGIVIDKITKLSEKQIGQTLFEQLTRSGAGFRNFE